MKCSNPACSRELFKVQVERRRIDPMRPEELPVRLTCAHCGKQVKAWITNEQMRQIINLLNELNTEIEFLRRLDKTARVELTVEHKPWWKFW